MTNKAPAFQFYAKEWLADKNVRLMTPAEKGGYIELMAIEWNERGRLTNDDGELAILSGLGVAWQKGSGKKIRACFKKRGKFLYHPRLERERKKQKDWLIKCAKGGKGFKPSENKAKKGKGTSVLLASKKQVNSNIAVFSLQSSVYSLLSSLKDSSIIPPEKGASISYREFFDKVFWKLYPARNGKKLEKEETWKRFLKLAEEDKIKVTQAAKNYADSQAVQDGIGIRDPKRFLKDGKGNEPWRDWIEPEKIKSGGKNGTGDGRTKKHTGLGEKDYGEGVEEFSG